MKQTKRIRAVLCGNSSVGKSSILKRFSERTFEGNLEPTVAGTFKTTCVQKNNEVINLEIWDTAGDERYGSIIPTFFKKAGVIAIIYDVTCPQSFENLTYWINIAKDNAPINTPFFIAGNKVDLEDNRRVTYEELKSFADVTNCDGFIETSAKTGEGIDDLFSLISSVPPNEVFESQIMPESPIKLGKRCC
ncbi:Ras-related protein Rab-31 [Tritrichomonas foetus]|uniref:Ras-related protein Rab-31 n=1 Tax=Tritrichomonas foetus TaxID=1144522 RepID=A0A1J4J7H3_9EUKA|nr:Ras-related protein Rab-31 [Tritrichomonas foetus]|eukprot:OHS95088.1 Ras-related protein Rab-31 [Tritrichomonas foetus]